MKINKIKIMRIGLSIIMGMITTIISLWNIFYMGFYAGAIIMIFANGYLYYYYLEDAN